VSAKRVQLIRGFPGTETVSTALIADGLINALKESQPPGLSIEEYRPKWTLPRQLQGKWGLRLSQYFLYPLQVPPANGSITHILNHGYAHLLYTRNPVRTVVSVTDLMPVLWWKGLLPVSKRKKIPLTVLYSLYALKRAAHITTISASTKDDLVKLIGCDPSRISVVYLGVDSIFKPYAADGRKNLRQQIFGFGSKKIILITGGQFYKNHETALQTIKQLSMDGFEDICLAKTGEAHPAWLDLVKKYQLEDRVVNLGFIPRSRMPDLYNAVDLLFFPSLYEGFGWPPLEAMACGTPAVTSNAGSLPEVMGSLDTMCAPFNIIGFSTMIRALLDNEDYRQRIIQQGIAQSANFNWMDTAKKIIDVYNLVDGPK
jgi:glycosyltransferase involved in cell wall biosynthesis